MQTIAVDEQKKNEVLRLLTGPPIDPSLPELMVLHQSRWNTAIGIDASETVTVSEQLKFCNRALCATTFSRP